MDNFENYLFSTTRKRKIVIITGTSTFIALFFLRFFVIPIITGTPVQGIIFVLTSVLDNLMIALASGLTIAALVFWIMPPQMKNAVIDVIEPTELEGSLADSLKNTTEFWYRGHTARWTRSVSLPELARTARLENSSKKIYIVILDPTNYQVCKYYATVRQRFRSSQENIWTAENTRLEILATIVSIYSWGFQEPSLEIKIALVDKVSVFRVDLSSHTAIITKEDIREPALRCESGSLFYRSFREDVIMSFQQARKLPSDIQATSLAQLNNQNVKKLLSDLGLEISDLTNEDVTKIISICHNAKKPYSS